MIYTKYGNIHVMKKMFTQKEIWEKPYAFFIFFYI